MGYSLAQDSLRTGTSNIHAGFQCCPGAAGRERTLVSKRLHCFGKEGSSSFSLLTSELKRSFERASETQALQNLLELDLTLCGFLYSSEG